MAGEQLFSMINSRGGKDSEYANIVYGRVTSTNPLKIQYSNQIILDNNFLEVSPSLSKIKLSGNLNTDDYSGQATITIDNSLRIGDKVTMVRCDGGQRFYVLERVT